MANRAPSSVTCVPLMFRWMMDLQWPPMSLIFPEKEQLLVGCFMKNAYRRDNIYKIKSFSPLQCNKCIYFVFESS